jgi:hypothetical protein
MSSYKSYAFCCLKSRVFIFCLYPERTPFSLTPRVFGCVAFVYVLDPGRDNLSPRSRKFIFLGYSRTQKSYRCYSPESR